MEIIILDNDIKVFFIKANSFPDGIEEAYKKLNGLFPYSADRKYFGISRPENGVITYKAATEIIPGEAEKFNCETLILKKGNYICITVNDFMKNVESIGMAFKELISNPETDPEGYCVEWYFNDKDVRCMVRLNRI